MESGVSYIQELSRLLLRSECLISGVRSVIDGESPPLCRHLRTPDRFFFAPVVSDIVSGMVIDAVDQFCLKNSMPT